MATLQDLLKKAYSSSGDYIKAVTETFNNLNKNSIVTMGNTQYALLTTPNIYSGSINTAVDSFQPAEMSLTLTKMDGTANRVSVAGPYNSWNKDKKLEIQDQYRNMYDYLNNIEPIELGRSLTDDEMDDITDTLIKAKKNKTSNLINYSGSGLDNAINYLNSDRSSININTNASSTVDNSPLGKLNRLMSKSNVEKKMWTNRDFVFGDDFINNQEFQNKVLDFYSQDGRKEDLFNKLARLDNYSADKFYYQTYSNAFEAYKELEGLDTAGMQKKVIERLKSLGYTEKDLRHHFEILREGADFINWQGSRKFIDYDSNLYNSANNVQQQAASRQRRRGNRKDRTHTAPNDPQSTASAGPKIGDNFLNKNGDQVVIADIYDNWNGTNYAMVNQNGKRIEESFLDDYTPYKGDKLIDAKIAKKFSDKWSELRNLKDEFMDFRRDNPSWSAQERLDWIKEKVDPVVKSLNGYNSRMNKHLGTRRAFDKHDYDTYIKSFAKDQKMFARAEIKQQAQQQAQQTQNNQRRTRINRNAAAWTDEEIANMADGDLDVYNELIKKRETARAQIKQREEEVRIKKERKRELKEDRKRRRQEQINSRKKNNINEKEYSSMWENLLNEQEQQKNVDDLFFGNGDTGGGSSYSYDIPDDEKVVKTVEDWLESNFNNRDYTVNGNSSASDIDFWASWTDDDILQISEDLVGDYDDDTISKIMDKMIEFREFSINHKNTNTNINSGGGSSANSGNGGSSGASGGSGGSSNSTGGSSSSTKTHLYKRNGKMRQLSHGSSKYSANTKFKVNTNSGHLPRISNKAVKTIGTMSALNTIFNVAGAVSDYKNARREGKGVVGATLKAGAEFALGEMLGLKGQLALFAVRAIPSAAIAGADMLYKESRRMNSAANQGLFGNAQFQDTQQLATMRQSGMEMAKMANYNLQQTLMGNEATYFHR